MHRRILLLTTLFVGACGQGDGAAAPGASAEGPDSASSGKLTPAYLSGDWCYSHNVISDERSDEGLSYRFAADGSLLYQVNQSTPVEKPGSYTIEEGHLKISPTLRFFDFTVESIDPESMVLRMTYGLAFWKRGSCRM